MKALKKYWPFILAAVAIAAFFVIRKMKGAAVNGDGPPQTGTATQPGSTPAAQTGTTTGTPQTGTTTGAGGATNSTPSTSTGNAQNDAIENPTQPATPEPAKWNGYKVSDIQKAGESAYELFRQMFAKKGKEPTKKQENKFWKDQAKQYAETHSPDYSFN